MAWPGVGLAAIEVQGGHVGRDAGGWSQESHGQRYRIASAVLQVQDANKVLTGLLTQRSSPGGSARAHTWSLCP